MRRPTEDDSLVALVLSGGVGLGAYQAGAFAALARHEDRLDWVAGSSIGAVNAAIIAGNAPQDRTRRLRDFWNAAAVEPLLAWAGQGESWPAQRALQVMGALRARLWGTPSLFGPRLTAAASSKYPSLYDLRPLRKALERSVDFNRLNDGTVRLAVVTTDIESGEEVVFDTGRSQRIEVEHLLASCGYLPEFPPVEIGGRVLGDGGLSSNTPVHAILGAAEARQRDLFCFVIENFPRSADRPDTLETSARRRRDLTFACQTMHRLGSESRERRLLAAIEHLATRLPAEMRDDPALVPILGKAATAKATVLYLGYDQRAEGAGPESHFDFSEAALKGRWEAGAADMNAVLALSCERSHQDDREAMAVHEYRSGRLQKLDF